MLTPSSASCGSESRDYYALLAFAHCQHCVSSPGHQTSDECFRRFGSLPQDFKLSPSWWQGRAQCALGLILGATPSIQVDSSNRLPFCWSQQVDGSLWQSEPVKDSYLSRRHYYQVVADDDQGLIEPSVLHALSLIDRTLMRTNIISPLKLQLFQFF